MSRKARAQFEDRGSALWVTIRSPLHLVSTLFSGVWLAVWLFGGGAGVWNLLAGQTRWSAFFVFFIVWSLVGALVGHGVLWALFGREVVTTDGVVLTIRRQLFRFARERRYEVASVKDLRCDPDFEPFRRAPVGDLVFEYEGKTIRFGDELGRWEAEQVLERLTRWKPRRR